MHFKVSKYFMDHPSLHSINLSFTSLHNLDSSPRSPSIFVATQPIGGDTLNFIWRVLHLFLHLFYRYRNRRIPSFFHNTALLHAQLAKGGGAPCTSDTTQISNIPRICVYWLLRGIEEYSTLRIPAGTMMRDRWKIGSEKLCVVLKVA